MTAVLGSVVSWVYDRLAAGRPDPGADFLSGNFAPVDKEVHSQDLEVEGVVPEGLNGAFIRTGPNPYFKPVGGYHWFDGDGMLHGVRLGGGKALSYANSWVNTSRLQQEKAAGKPLCLKAGDLWGSRALVLLMLDKLKRSLSVYRKDQGAGVANTALVYHAQRLLVLHEGDLPYQIRMLCSGVLETVGRLCVRGDPGGAFPSPFTAHPKLDPVTGELFTFGYSLETKPYVRAAMMDAKGLMTKQWVVDTAYPSMMHDCALTPSYAVFLHLPLTFDPKRMIKEQTLPLAFKPELPARVGLLRRDAPGCPVPVMTPGAPTAPVQWFDLPPNFVFHVANAWEDSTGRVHVVVCQFEAFNFHGFNAKEKVPPPVEERQHLTEWVLDPATGTATVRRLSDTVHTDFPVVNPRLAGRATQFVWGADFTFGVQTAHARGIAKFDVTVPEGTDACVGRITFPEGCEGGEAVFVPRPPAPGTTQDSQPEDDGWLVVYVHDSAADRSALHVYDARSMSSTPLARVFTPQRVPFGFHGTWVWADQLAAQKDAL